MNNVTSSKLNNGTTLSSTVFLFNARSLCNKLSDFQYFLYNNNPPIVFVTETWCKPDIIHDATLCGHPSYQIYRCDREGNTVGGGIIALVFDKLSHHLISTRNFSPFCQCLILRVYVEQHAVYFILFYRSPTCQASPFNEALAYVSQFLEDTSKCVILGDLNFPTIKWFGNDSSYMYMGRRDNSAKSMPSRNM